MKHFVDIEHIREYGDNGVAKCNTQAFEVGDIIQITEKYDGSNASAYWDGEAMHACSRKQDLTSTNTLNGFYTFIQTLAEKTVEVFKTNADLIVFGEWTCKNKIIYNDTGKQNHWYVYDIFNTTTEEWMPQSLVKAFAAQAGLEYIHVLYEGPFVSWEHCRTFMNSPAYGDTQEGIVIKNQTKLNNNETRCPVYLKIVNESFKERMAGKVREPKDPTKEAEMKAALENAKLIVTQARVEKIILKAQADGVLPTELTPQDMKEVAKVVPSAVYNDCIKEEKDIVTLVGDNFGKICGSLSMQFARQFILGK